MPFSKVNNGYDFNENKWVISLINTGEGTGGILGGHAKIIVEGQRRKHIPGYFSPELELCVGEFHIAEVRIAADVAAESESSGITKWLYDNTQWLRNTRCNYMVLTSYVPGGDENEVFRNEYYEDKEKQYSSSAAKSWFVTPDAARKMINDILDEKFGRGVYAGRPKQFQYAGNWCIYAYEGGQNCTTWAEEKLAIAGAGNGKILTDSSKAAPVIHTRCVLL